MPSSTILCAGLLCLAAIGCGTKPPAADGPPSSAGAPVTPGAPGTPAGSITDREWVLVAVGEQTSPVGAGGQPATLRLDSTTSRAAGFAGCNRFAGQYTLSGNNLSFGPLVSTKMACADGDELERSFLAALSRVATFTAADSTLALETKDGPLLRFAAR